VGKGDWVREAKVGVGLHEEVEEVRAVTIGHMALGGC